MKLLCLQGTMCDLGVSAYQLPKLLLEINQENSFVLYIESTYICYISESSNNKRGYILLSAYYVTVTLLGNLCKVIISFNAHSNPVKQVLALTPRGK